MENIFRTVVRMYDGRINQQQFVILGIIAFIVAWVVGNIGMQFGILFGITATLVISAMLQSFILIFTMHLYVRRLHDLGTTGWVAVIVIIAILLHPLLGLLCFLALAVLASAPYKNQFGPVPDKDRPLLKTFMNT